MASMHDSIRWISQQPEGGVVYVDANKHAQREGVAWQEGCKLLGYG